MNSVSRPSFKRKPAVPACATPYGGSVRLVRLLPDRWQKLFQEALKFGAVGGINLVVNYAVFNALVLTVFATGQLKATVIATVVSATLSYLMNRHWTFRDRQKSAVRREYLLFFFFNATGLAIELAVLAAAKYGFGLTSLLALNAAKTVGVAIGTVFRFWSYRTFVFQPAPALSPQPADPAPHAAAASFDPVDVTGIRSDDPGRLALDLELTGLDRRPAFELNPADRDTVRR